MKKINYKNFILDLAGYLKFSIDNNIKDKITLLNLSHDIFQILLNPKKIVPRTKGYKKYIQ